MIIVYAYIYMLLLLLICDTCISFQLLAKWNDWNSRGEKYISGGCQYPENNPGYVTSLKYKILQ